MKVKRLQPVKWFTGEEPGPAFLDLPDDILELVIRYFTDAHDIEIDPYSRHWLGPFVPAVLCRRMRGIALSRSAFWSTLVLSWYTTVTEPELIETIISRSKNWPMHVHLHGMHEGLKSFEVARNILQRIWPRVARLSTGEQPFKSLFKFLQPDEHGQMHNQEPSIIADLYINDHRGPLDIRRLVGPRITRIRLRSVTMQTEHFVWMLGHCRSLQHLSLHHVTVAGATEYLNMFGKEGRLTATQSGRSRSLSHLEIIHVSALAGVIAMIRSQFPGTVESVPCIIVKAQPTALDLETNFNIIDMTQHIPSQELVLEWRNPYHHYYGHSHCFCSTDGRLLRQSCVCYYRAHLREPGPLRAGILGVLQHIVRLNIEFTSVQDLFTWVDAWRGESFPNLRRAKIEFQTGSRRYDQEDLFVPVHADAQHINAPQLQALHFGGRVGWENSDAKYYKDAPLVKYWARLCAAVFGSFLSMHAIDVEVTSTREFVVSSQTLQEALASVMNS